MVESADTRCGKLRLKPFGFKPNGIVAPLPLLFAKNFAPQSFLRDSGILLYKIFGRKKLTINSQKNCKLHKNARYCGGIGRHKGLKIFGRKKLTKNSQKI